MEELSLHILDIVENSIDAGAKTIEILLIEDTAINQMTITIKDDGRGMDKATLAKVFDPFFTSRKVRRVGLGLPLLKQAAEAAGGELRIESQPGRGSVVRATFQLDHIDRQPLGDMAKTMMTLIIGNTNVHFIYLHQKDLKKFYLDTEKLVLKDYLSPISVAELSRLVRNILQEQYKSQ